MNTLRFLVMFVFGAVFCLTGFSCTTSGLSIKKTTAWVREGAAGEGRRLRAGTIHADKPGGGLSVEREIAELLPLVFLEKGYFFVEGGEDADFIVDVRATERDYYSGWEAQKSVTMEIRIWRAQTGPEERKTESARRVRVETPIAAGRTLAQGAQGLSVSKNTEALLRRSVARAVESLARVDAKADGKVEAAYAGPRDDSEFN